MASPQRIRVSLLMAISVFAGCLLQAPVARADMTTASVDNARSGWDQNEPGLGPDAVSSSKFGKIFATPVDGQVYAEPLIADGRVVVATENNAVYGLDPASGAVKWTRKDLGAAWPSAAINCSDLAPNVGVTATPVYDPATDSVFLTAKSYDGNDPSTGQWSMHKLDPITGAERPGWPVTIAGSPDNDPGRSFDPNQQMQRSGLLLLDGVVYAAFGSHCDTDPYQGIVVGVSAADGTQTAMWSDQADGVNNGGGIWQSGGGLASDGSGQILLSTGNGYSPDPGTPGSNPPPTLAESVVRLQVNPDGSLAATDFFSPSNNADLDANDTDLGSGAPVVLPDGVFGTPAVPHVLVQEGKDGRVFLLDRDNLGGMGQNPDGSDAVVNVIGPYEGQWGHPAVWGGDGGYVYLVNINAPMRAFKAGVDGSGNPTLTEAGATADNFGYTSGSPVVTSNGAASGSAVVWEVSTDDETGSNGQLRAYGAVPGADGTLPLLWSAPIGTASKFIIPATDSGRVYVGTRDGQVIAFGNNAIAPAANSPIGLGQGRPDSPTGMLPAATAGAGTVDTPMSTAGDPASATTAQTPNAAG